MKKQIHIKLQFTVVLISVLGVTSCTSMKSLTNPEENSNMEQIYEKFFEEGKSDYLKDDAIPYSDQFFARTEQLNQYGIPNFKKLPNPTIYVYVFQHLAEDARVPVPGYWTAFPLYERVEYALPGETQFDTN